MAVDAGVVINPLTASGQVEGGMVQALGYAHWLGFRVAVTDDREALASAEHIPNADVYLPGAFATAVSNFTITRNTYITVVTRNVQVDCAILPQLVQTPAPYIGMSENCSPNSLLGHRTSCSRYKRRLCCI